MRKVIARNPDIFRFYELELEDNNNITYDYDSLTNRIFNNEVSQYDFHTYCKYLPLIDNIISYDFNNNTIKYRNITLDIDYQELQAVAVLALLDAIKLAKKENISDASSLIINFCFYTINN